MRRKVRRLIGYLCLVPPALLMGTLFILPVFLAIVTDDPEARVLGVLICAVYVLLGLMLLGFHLLYRND